MKKEDIHLKPLPKGKALNNIPYIPKSVAGATRQVIAHTKKRCGVRDTVASVPATFLILFSSPEKRR